MADALKDIYSKKFITQFAQQCSEIIPSFNPLAFSRFIFNTEWESKALKQRMSHIATAIHVQLDTDYRKSIKQLLQIIDHLKSKNIQSGFEYLFFPDFVEQYGQEHPDQSLIAIEKITAFSSCEFAIRPFIKTHPEKVMKQMLKWSTHKNLHVRRLSSEGCRPRLPWAMALQDLKKDPAPILPILENLKSDSSEYVRRSVANNLNDIAKDHPAIVSSIVKKWQGLSKETDWIVRHGSRTLLKKADAEIYSLFGLSGTHTASINNFKIKPKTISLGGILHFSFDLINGGQVPAKLRIDFAVYYMKSSGSQNRKLFRISENLYEPGQAYSFNKKISFSDLTTRKHYAGKHAIAIVVNGNEMVTEQFKVVI
jgi:3-methyladenine DNA glycosylase AlkC